MTYKPVNPGRLYEHIVEQIEARILKGELKSGDKLPPEHELASQFGVSRTAIREAMKNLTSRGLVEVQAGRGTFVIDNPYKAVQHSLGLLLKLERDDSYKNLIDFREILEPEIAARAASQISDEDIAALQEALTTMQASLNDAETFIEADLDFHLTLAEAANNSLILAIVDTLIELLRDQRRNIANKVEGGARGQVHHKRIFEAVVRRDPEAARQAMRAHICQVREELVTKAEPPKKEQVL